MEGLIGSIRPLNPMTARPRLEAGYPTVATLGSHVKREHVEFLQGFPRVYLVPHRDDAGRQMWRECQAAFGGRLRMVLVSEGMKDVGDLAQQTTTPAQVFGLLAARPSGRLLRRKLSSAVPPPGNGLDHGPLLC